MNDDRRGRTVFFRVQRIPAVRKIGPEQYQITVLKGRDVVPDNPFPGTRDNKVKLKILMGVDARRAIVMVVLYQEFQRDLVHCESLET